MYGCKQAGQAQQPCNFLARLHKPISSGGGTCCRQTAASLCCPACSYTPQACSASGVQDKTDEEVQKRWHEMCKKLNLRELNAPRLYTVADDIEVGGVLMVDMNWKCSSMKFINCHLHDGLAGKGPPRSAFGGLPAVMVGSLADGSGYGEDSCVAAGLSCTMHGVVMMAVSSTLAGSQHACAALADAAAP